MGIVEYLLTQINTTIIEYDAVIAQAARYGTTKIIQLFFDQIDARFILSEKMLCAAAMKSRYGVSMLKLLIEHDGGCVCFTENLLCATLPARHSYSSEHTCDAIEWLLKEHGDEFGMTAELVRDLVESCDCTLWLMVRYKHQDFKRFARHVLLAMTKRP